jgi:hypothetical protein
MKGFTRMSATPFRLALVLCAALAPLAAHAETHINIKPGLWETTVTVAMGGLPDMPDMSKLSPERRAQMETAMKRMSLPHREKSCITAEQIRKGPDFKEPEPSCRRNISVNSATAWSMTEECRGERPRTVHATFKASNPETISGQSDATATTPHGTVTSKATFTGKWLGADCGGITPAEAPKKK